MERSFHLVSLDLSRRDAARRRGPCTPWHPDRRLGAAAGTGPKTGPSIRRESWTPPPRSCGRVYNPAGHVEPVPIDLLDDRVADLCAVAAPRNPPSCAHLSATQQRPTPHGDNRGCRRRYIPGGRLQRDVCRCTDGCPDDGCGRCDLTTLNRQSIEASCTWGGVARLTGGLRRSRGGARQRDSRRRNIARRWAAPIVGRTATPHGPVHMAVLPVSRLRALGESIG